jgi:tetratricopeptide (TPR) repeat protein
MQTHLNRNWFTWKRLVGVVAAIIVLILVGVFVVAPETDPDKQYERGLAAVADEDFPTAYREIESLEKIEAGSARLHTLRAALRLKLGNPAGALRHLTHVQPTDAVHATAMLIGGESYYRLHQLAEAEACLLPLATDQPDLVDPHRWLASIYYDLGAMPKANTQIEHIIRLAPDDYRPWDLKGVIFSDLDKPAEAAESFQQALAHQPPDDKRPRIVRELARNLIANLQHAEALILLDESIGDGVPDAMTMALRGECLWSTGQKDVARQVCDRALELDPDDRTAILLKLRIGKQDNEYSEIIEPLQKLLLQTPHDTEIRYQLGMALRQIGKAEQSTAELKKMEASLDLKNRATELFAKANQQTDDPGVRDELVKICIELGQPELAAMWHRAAEALRKRQSIRNRRSDLNGEGAAH